MSKRSVRRLLWSTPALILITLGLLQTTRTGVHTARSSIHYDRGSVWAVLGLGQGSAEADYDAALSGLSAVEIEPAVEVGSDYEPSFPEPLPFDPSEWETSTPDRGVRVPDAPKGGTFRVAYQYWPPTIRTEGPNSRSAFLTDIHDFVYERLLEYEPGRGSFTPSLATHWKISEDKRTFTFRIDARARWSNGREVTADDVAATIEHLQNPDRKDPSTSQYWQEMIESVEVLDKYTVAVTSREARWRTLMNLASQNIYPAAYIRMDGETYIRDWNWKLLPGSGPYIVRPEDIRKGRSITLRRRTDWWRKDDVDRQGMYNFDAIEWLIVRDVELQYQKLLAGEIDAYLLSRSSRWVAELDDEEPIRNGWVQKRKVFNRVPRGCGGYCFNMRRAPFSSRNVRLAFAHLTNRERLQAKFFYYQYEYTDSYFPNSQWVRPDAERVPFNAGEARRLLALDGWSDRDSEGYLINARGERFPELTLEYATPSFKRIHDVIRNDLWDEAGIKLDLKLMDRATWLKKIWEYQFDVTFFNWTGVLFPEPYRNWHSDFADQPQTNNLCGFANAEADQLTEHYMVEFDVQERQRMLQRLDEIIFDAHPYALAWFGPYFRVLYWDKFGHPPEYADPYEREVRNIITYWWHDPARERRTMENKSKNVSNYPDKPVSQYDDPEWTYWKYNAEPMPDDT
jgi:microcin C transport system substrate-binding protein